MNEENPYAGGTQIGQGWAQVFKPYENPYMDRYIARLEKSKEEEGERTRNVLKELSALNKADILPKDQPRFAEMQTGIRQYVKDNIDALRSGDINTTLEFQQKMNDYATKAANSKAYRGEVYEAGKLMAVNSDKFSDEMRKRLDEMSQSSFLPDGTQRTFDWTSLQKAQNEFNVVNFWKNVKNSYDPDKKVYTITNPKNGQITTFTEEQIKNPRALADDILTLPDYNEHLRDKLNQLKTTDPVKYKELETKALADGGSKNILTEYAVQEIQERLPSETGKVQKAVPKGTSVNVRTGDGGSGKTDKIKISIEPADAFVVPGKAVKTSPNVQSLIGKGRKDLFKSMDAETQKKYRQNLISFKVDRGTQKITEVTEYEPLQSEETKNLVAAGGGNLKQDNYTDENGEPIKFTPQQIYKKNGKYYLRGIDENDSVEDIPYNTRNKSVLGVAPEEEFPTEQKTSKTFVGQSKAKAPKAPEKAKGKVYTAAEWNKFTLSERRKLQKQGASFK